MMEFNLFIWIISSHGHIHSDTETQTCSCSQTCNFKRLPYILQSIVTYIKYYRSQRNVRLAWPYAKHQGADGSGKTVKTFKLCDINGNRYSYTTWL